MKHPHLSRHEPAHALQEPPEAAPEADEEVIVEIPILETHVQVGVKRTEDGGFVMLNLSTVLSHDNLYALDRSQAITLGGQLIDFGRQLPSAKQQKKLYVAGGGLATP